MNLSTTLTISAVSISKSIAYSGSNEQVVSIPCIDIQLSNGEMLSFEKYTIPGAPEKKYAYCSDTKYDESIISHIKKVDLLYHEATFTNEFSDRAKATSHSTASDAANIAKKAEVGKLLLGHLSARFDSVKAHLEEAVPIFENSTVVEDGEVYQVV